MRGKPAVLVLLALIASVAVPVALGASGSSPASGLGGSAAANKAKAESEAMRLLSMIQLPPGMTPSASEPAGDQGTLAGPGSMPGTPNFVDAHAWWTTTDDASAIFDYVKAHLPPGAKGPTTAGYGGGPPGTVENAFESWNLPPIPGVLTQRTVSVSAAALNGRVIGVRTDGEAIWQTPRPSWELIPASARTAVMTAHGADPHTGRPTPTSTPATLTAAQTQKLVAFINGAEIVQPGVRSCPAGFDDAVTLAFEDQHGDVVARAVENPSGCATITLTLGGRTGPDLNDYPSMTAELARIGAIRGCTGEQLAPAVALPARNGRPSARSAAFSFLNHSKRLCTLAGFPRLTLLTAAGASLHIKLTDLAASLVRQEGSNATRVLYPRTSDGFGAQFTVCAGAPVATTARVRLPGIARPFTLAVGSRAAPFAPCNGEVGVGDLGSGG